MFGFVRETYSSEEDIPTTKRIFLYDYEADAIEFFLLSLKKELTPFIDEKQEMSLGYSIDYSMDGWENVNFVNLDNKIFSSISFYNQPRTFQASLKRIEEIFKENLLSYKKMLETNFSSFEGLKKCYYNIPYKRYGGGFSSLKLVSFDYSFLDSSNISINENPMEI